MVISPALPLSVEKDLNESELKSSNLELEESSISSAEFRNQLQQLHFLKGN